MKRMKLRELRPLIRAMSDEQIAVTFTDERKTLMTLRTQAVTEKVEDNQQFPWTRRMVARVLTERRARELKKTPKKVRTPAVK